MEKLYDELNESISKLLNICQSEEYRALQNVYHVCCRCLSQIQANHQTKNSTTNTVMHVTSNTHVDVKYSDGDVDELFSNVKKLDKFVWFAFSRRYGWLDQNNKECIKDLTCIPVSPPGQKSGLINLLDIFIKWFQLLRPKPAVIDGYIKLVTNASTLPVIRNRSVVHILSWLQCHHHELVQPATFSSVKGLLLLCVTDVWSPIRKAACNRLGSIVELLPSDARDDLFNELVKVCLDPEAPWQAKNGAIAAISSLLYQFLLERMDSEVNLSLLTPYVSSLRWPQRSMTDFVMPAVVSRNIDNVVFSLVCHSQQTIRETAAKAFSFYISSTNQKETLKTLDKVMSLLTAEEKYSDADAGCRAVDAYKAEGLLGICHFIFKFLPQCHLLAEWCKHWTTLVTFLSHPASTVRQCTSNIFKLLVQRSNNNPVLFQLVLQSLTSGWHPSLEERSDLKSKTQTDSWEGREGRLFAYESICHYVIKDHVCKIFSPEATHKQKQTRENGEEPRIPRSAERISGCAKLVSSLDGCSLLNQIKMLDAFYTQITRGAGHSSERIAEIQETVMRCCAGCPEIQQLEDRQLKSLKFVQCGDLFKLMLYQTVHCLADSQWELRRIALQVFPYLAEVIRWYNCDIMVDIWKQIKPSSSSLTLYMALYLLRENVVHGARLKPLLHKPSEQHKASRSAIQEIVDCIQSNILSCLSLVDLTLRRNCFDRLSVLSAEIITVCLVHFDIPENQRSRLGSSVITFWKNLFCFAHPNSRICKEVFKCSENNFTSPHYGYLSCCLVRPDGDMQCARQVEKVFMKRMIDSLQAFLRVQPVSRAAQCLPMLAHNVGLFVADVSSCKSLLRSLSMEAHFVIDQVLKLAPGEERHTCLQAIFFTLKELAAVIAMKSFDSQLLQKILNVYLVLCRPINPTRHLRIIFKSVCARMGERERLMSCDLSPRPEQDADISLLWRDFSMSQVDGQWSEPDDDDHSCEDEDLASMYSECLSLNISCNSGSLSLTMKSRAGSVHSDDDGHHGTERPTDDDDSDWDSWSDEEEDDCTLMNMFSHFLTQMKNIFGKDSSAIFLKEILSLEREEREFILKLVGDLESTHL